MIAMMTTLCVSVSLLMTTNAALPHSHHLQASHELGFDQQVIFHGLSRKLMLQEMVEGYGDQDLEFYNDQKEALLGDETRRRGEEMMVNTVKGSDPTYFTSMDYSHVRRRRPIHNKSYSKITDSP